MTSVSAMNLISGACWARRVKGKARQAAKANRDNRTEAFLMLGSFSETQGFVPLDVGTGAWGCLARCTRQGKRPGCPRLSEGGFDFPFRHPPRRNLSTEQPQSDIRIFTTGPLRGTKNR